MTKAAPLIQLVIAPFTTPNGSSYSMFGLASDGSVWQYKGKGWVALPMNEVPPSVPKANPFFDTRGGSGQF